MNRYARIALAAAVAAAGTAHAASAQLPVIPYGPVNTGLGINVSADYAKPTGSGATGSAWGLSAGLGLSRLGISASFGGLTGGGTNLTTFGGMAGLKLFGGGLTPVEIGAQVGANVIGSYTVGVTTVSSTTNILPGAWVKINPPLFPLKPWVQVYDLISNQPFTASGGKSEVRFAVGANFNLLLGLGVHAGYDFGSGTGSAKSWGIGAHMNFRVPSLGVPGM
jgi:hypothetical protein